MLAPHDARTASAGAAGAANASVTAEVAHLPYSSVGGAERGTGIPHFEIKPRVEERVLSLGLPATFLRPVFFMKNLGATHEDGETVRRLPLPGGTPLQMVAVHDIGAVSAAALLDPSLVPALRSRPPLTSSPANRWPRCSADATSRCPSRCSTTPNLAVMFT